MTWLARTISVAVLAGLCWLAYRTICIRREYRDDEHEKSEHK